MDNEKERGAIVIEATISLTAFMFTIVIILSIVNICLAQAKIGTVINGAAKDISQYTYIYSLTDLPNIQSNYHKQANDARSELDNAVGQMTNVFTAVEPLLAVMEKFSTDPELQDSLIAFLKDTGMEAGKSVATAIIVKAFAKERIVNYDQDCDTYLRRLGIKDGLDGLDFYDSVLCYGGGDEIRIVVNYEVEVLKLLNHDIKINFTQCAATKAWFSASSSD